MTGQYVKCVLTLSLFQTVADEKRVVDEQRRTLDEEIADFQRRKVGCLNFSSGSVLFFIFIGIDIRTMS